MEIQSLEALTRQHSTTSRFGPHGLYLGDRVPTPDASLRWVQEIVAAYDLSEGVPSEVRGYLEVARRLHIYGYFEYPFFTVASERAMFAAELGVRLRFLEWHGGLVPIERGKGESIERTVIETTDTWAFDSEFRSRRSKRWRLTGTPAFNGSFTAHLEWARENIDLGAYFSEGRLKGLADLRNQAAHPAMDTRVGPPDSSLSIEFSWRLINALWGVPAGGDLQ